LRGVVVVKVDRIPFPKYKNSSLLGVEFRAVFIESGYDISRWEITRI
jgi:hypothetical protein